MREIFCDTLKRALNTKEALEKKGWDVDSEIAERNGKFVVRVYGFKLFELIRG